MTTFLDVVELLLTDDDSKASYSADPDGFLSEHGLGDLDSADVADAMLYSTDSLPLPVATRLNPEAGLDSAAALDLEADGLSLEREAYDAAVEEVAVEEVAVEEVEVEDAVSSNLGDDVDFDAPSDAAGNTDPDAVDLLDAPSVNAAEAASTSGAIDIGIDTPSEALDEVEAPADTEPAVDGTNSAVDDLTDFVPTEDVVVESTEVRLDDDLDELDIEEILESDDLDFLE